MPDRKKSASRERKASRQEKFVLPTLKQSEQGLTLEARDGKHLPLPGRLGMDGVIAYESNGYQCQQTLRGADCILSVNLSAGRVELTQRPQEGPQARLFWGGVSRTPWWATA